MKQISPLSPENVRLLDRYAIESLQIPGTLLMENAGRSLTDSLMRHVSFDESPSPKILILAGPGNNGGDGFVMARRLQLLGISTVVAAIGAPSRWKGDALVNLQILKRLVDDDLSLHFFDFNDINKEILLQKIDEFVQKSDWIVDALLGTGISGAPRSPIKEIITLLNRASKKVFAVDIPSGLNADLGIPFDSEIDAVRAQVTCTLAAVKTGFLKPSSTPYLGILELGDIGVNPEKLIA